MQLPHYLPIEVIFNLLCVCRSLRSTSTQAIRRGMYRRGLYYGSYDSIANFGFWVGLCQAAFLLDEGLPPRPTLYAPDWLSMPWVEQFATLVEAWKNMPANPRIQLARAQLITLLLSGEELVTSYQRETGGLEALGLYERGELTFWGSEFLKGTLRLNPNAAVQAWEISDDELHIPYPPNWKTLWDLESYLTPIDPGIYALDEKALRRAVQHTENDASDLLQILQQGLRESLPQELIRRIESQPILIVLPGLVLEFSSPEELSQLRRNVSIRQEMAAILSPHHVYIETWQAERVLERLQRFGLVSNKDMLSSRRDSLLNQLRLTNNERAYLLCTLLIQDGLDIPTSAPPGLLAKLTEDLPVVLRAAAARNAKAILEEHMPRSTWLHEEEIPPVPEIYTINRIEEAIQKQQVIDILYQKAAQYHPEYRRVSPLSIEQRNLRFYLIAYCHIRKANRTFRLDRLQLLQEPPCP